MTKIRRYYLKGNIYFVTCVTYKRTPILLENIDLYWDSIRSIKEKMTFDILAWVVNPDHFHFIIDPKDHNLSDIIKRIKLSFYMKYRTKHSGFSGRVWQYQFWDHVIRSEIDFNHHLDYIHYNPVKHNLVKSPFKHKESSIHKFKDIYSVDWGVTSELNIDGEFGE
jgi:putative transposase